MPEDGEQRAQDKLLRRGPFLTVLLLGLPLAIGLASHGVINLVDLALVGRLGGDAILAAHVASTWNFLPMIVGQCVSTALLAQLSRRLGEGDRDGARRLHLRAQWWMLWLSIGIGVLTALPAPWMVDETGLTGAARGDAIHYLVVSNLGCIPMFVLMQTTAAMRAVGEALVPLSLLLLANLLNLLGDVVLLYGWEAAGIPSIGVVGATYASVGSRAVAALLGWWWLRRRQHALSLRDVPEGERPPVGGPLLRDAWPQVVQIGLRAAVVLVLTAVAQRGYGNTVTVALGIATRLDTVVLFSSLGFANAATAFAGRAVVVGRAAAARWSGACAALLAGLFGMGVLLLCLANVTAITHCFLPTATDDELAAVQSYLGIAGWSQVLGAVALGAIGALHGAGRMISPLVVDLVGFAVLAAWFVIAAAGGGGIEPVYRALVGGTAVLAVLHLGHVAVGRWVRPL
ncbi:MAG: hypothetical protein H6838_17865 [Planctomycetes bacterium]|nr:hypothetical protein [Planctomycetota bacterium]